MGANSSSGASSGGPKVAPIVEAAGTGEKPKCKACCACPETKRARDECVMENGQENCSKLIEEHKECMRKMGFNI